MVKFYFGPPHGAIRWFIRNYSEIQDEGVFSEITFLFCGKEPEFFSCRDRRRSHEFDDDDEVSGRRRPDCLKRNG